MKGKAMLEHILPGLFGGEKAVIDRSTALLKDAKIQEAVQCAEGGWKKYPASAEMKLHFAAVMLMASVKLEWRVDLLHNVLVGLREFLHCASRDDPRRAEVNEIMQYARQQRAFWEDVFKKTQNNNTMIQVNWSDMCWMAVETASHLSRIGKHDLALQLCPMGKSLEGGKGDAAFVLEINCLKELGDDGGAKKACEEAMARESTYSTYYKNIGQTLVHYRATRAALECFDKALAIEGDDPVTLTNRGVCRVALGQVSGGRADLEKALQRADREQAQQITRLLNQIG
jgi:tetratricopeptide (TPR) repeat protein